MLISGGWFRIKHLKSVSTINFDVWFDRYAEMVETDPPTELLKPRIIDMASKTDGGVGDFAVSLEMIGTIETFMTKKGAQPFERLSLEVAERSVGARVTVDILGARAHVVETALTKVKAAKLTTTFVLRGCRIENLGVGIYRAVMGVGSTFDINSGTEEEARVLAWHASGIELNSVSPVGRPTHDSLELSEGADVRNEADGLLADSIVEIICLSVRLRVPV